MADEYRRQDHRLVPYLIRRLDAMEERQEQRHTENQKLWPQVATNTRDINDIHTWRKDEVDPTLEQFRNNAAEVRGGVKGAKLGFVVGGSAVAGGAAGKILGLLLAAIGTHG